MCLVIEDYIYYFRYLAGFVGHSVDIINWYNLEKFACIQAVLLYKAFVDKDFCSTGVN